MFKKRDNIKLNKNYPTLKNAFLLVLLVINAQIIIAIYLSIFSNKLNVLTTALINIISMGLVILIGHEKTRQKFKKVFPIKKIHIAHYLIIPMTCLGLVIVFSELDNILRYFLPMPELFERIFKQILPPGSIMGPIFLLVIVAPFTEEYLFRGLLLHGFLKNYSPAKAIILSSFLFAFIHLNPWQFLGAFFMGIYLAWYFIKTKSLVSCLLIHAMFNAIPVLVIHILKFKIPGLVINYTKDLAFQPLYLNIIGIIISITGILLSYFIFRKKA